MNKTNIEYLDYTWNPIAMRCDPVSAGCKNCWHLRMCNRLGNNPAIPYREQVAYQGGEPVLVERRLKDPERVKSPAIIGVQFMGDLLHSKVITMLEPILDVIDDARQHTFVILTKRPEQLWRIPYLHNVIVGTSIDDSNRMSLRRLYRLTDSFCSSKKFLSIEPLLEEIVLPTSSLKKLYCVIAGCESGPHRRHAEVDWFRSLRDQCQEAGVKFFLKQMEVNGKVISMPELDGKVWAEWLGD